MSMGKTPGDEYGQDPGKMRMGRTPGYEHGQEPGG